jgi:hypothetical protein
MFHANNYMKDRASYDRQGGNVDNTLSTASDWL